MVNDIAIWWNPRGRRTLERKRTRK